MPPDTQPAVSTPPDGELRRSFLTKLAATIIGGVAFLVPVAAGLATFLDPLRRRSGARRLVRVASLEAIPDNGLPVLFRVVTNRVDAWTQYKDEPVGAVYVRREGASVRAYSAVCPHLGCFISRGESKYQCPCHNSAFQFDGTRINPEASPAPRGMDELAVDVNMLSRGEVWVEFRTFVAGSPFKIDAISWERVG